MEGTTVSDGGVCDGGRGERDGARSNVSFHVSSFFFYGTHCPSTAATCVLPREEP